MAVSDELETVTVFELLSNERRLHALLYLSENPRSELSVVAEHVAAVEAGIDRAEVATSDRKRVFISLYQAHIPRLEEHGIVTYDSDEGVVELTGEERLLAPFDRSAPDRPWPGYYLGLAALGWIVIVVVVVAPTAPSVAFGVPAALTLVSLAHRRARARAGPDSLRDVVEPPGYDSNN